MVDLTKTKLFASYDPVRVKRIERMVNDKEYMAQHIKRLMLRRVGVFLFAPDGEIDVVVHDIRAYKDNLCLVFHIKTKDVGLTSGVYVEKNITRDLLKGLTADKHALYRRYCEVRRERLCKNSDNKDLHGGLRLQHDVMYDGKKCLLSTVELPHKKMYETMLFAYKGDKVNWRELFCKRYNSETDAKWGHFEAMGRLARDGSLPDPYGAVCVFGKADEVDDDE